MDPARLLQALDFAAKKHRDQRWRNAEASPYINHPITVAAVLAAEGGVSDKPTWLAAALHDTVGDTRTTFEELERHFGLDDSGLVRELTDDKPRPKGPRKHLPVQHARQSSAQAKAIKIGDKV